MRVAIVVLVACSGKPSTGPRTEPVIAGDATVVATGDAAPPAGLWARTFPQHRDGSTRAIVVTGDGVIVLGLVDKPIDFGGGELADGAVLARFDRDGKHAWSRRVPTGHQHNIGALAVATDGAVWVGGMAEELATKLATVTSKGIGMLARYSATGELGLVRASAVTVLRLAPAPDGGVFVVGRGRGDANLGDGVRACGDEGLVVARLAADGKPVWSRCAPAGGVTPGGLVAITGGDVVTCAAYSERITLEPGTELRATEMPGKGKAWNPDVVFARFAAATGKLVWAHSLGDGFQEDCDAMAPTPDGGFAIAGTGRALTGLPDNPHDNYADAMVAAFGADGKRRWGWALATPVYSFHAIAVDAAGSYLVAGRNADQHAPMTSFFRFAATGGEPTRLDVPGKLSLYALALDGDTMFAGGSVEATVTLLGKPIEATSPSIWLARLQAPR